MADDKLTVEVEARTRDAVKNLDKVETAVEDVEKSGVKAGKSLSKAFSDVGKIAGGVLTADAIKSGFKFLVDSVATVTTDFAQMGDSIAKTSSKLGVGQEALQELRFAAEQSGVGTQTFDVALQRLTRRAAEAASGTGVAKQAFKDLGIQLKDSQGNVRRTEDIFTDLAGAFQNVENDSEKVSLAFKLFDTEGVSLVNVLNAGSEGLEQFRQRARELGFVLTEDATAASVEFLDSQNELSKAFQGVKNGIAVEILPALTDLIKTVTEAIVENRALILDILSAAPRVFRIAAEAVAVFVAAMAVQKVVAFTQSLGGISGVMTGVITSIKSGTLAINLFKAAATLGLTVALDFIITKALELRETFGSWTAVFEYVGLVAEQVFTGIVLVVTEMEQSFAGLTDRLGITSGAAGRAAQDVKNLEARMVELTQTINEQEAAAKRNGGGIGPDPNATRDRANQNVQAVKSSLDIVKQLEADTNDQIRLQRLQAFETRLQDDVDLRNRLNELDLAHREKAINDLVEQTETEHDTRLNALLAREKQQKEFNARLAKEQTQAGKALIIIEEAIGKEKLQNLQNTNNRLMQLQQSDNAVLKGIGKAAAVTQITIDTAVGAVQAFNAFQFIPFVGGALGAAAAAAVVAFGVENIGKVLSAQSGGIVPQIPGQSSMRDSTPSILQPGELVVPTKNFDEVINSVAAQRGFVQQNEQPRDPIVVQLSLKDNLVEFVEAELLNRSRLGLSLEVT